MRTWHLLTAIGLIGLAAAGVEVYWPDADAQADDMDSLLDQMPVATGPASRPAAMRSPSPSEGYASATTTWWWICARCRG